MDLFSIGRFARPRPSWACAVAALGLGLGVAAAPVGAAAPTVPGRPTITSVTSGVRSVTVAFKKPADDGGAKITSYHVQCTSNKGKNGALNGPKSPITVTGLTPEQSYRCTVAARNSVGRGPASALSDAVLVKATTPSAPTITSATAGVHSVTVAFTKPSDDGGARIANYRVQCKASNGGTTGAQTATKSPIEVKGLNPGRKYTCVVAARNKVGLGAPSAKSDQVVPLAS
jgi:titin